MAGIEKQVKKAVKGTSGGKKHKKSGTSGKGGTSKGGSSIEKKAKKLLK